MKDNPVLNRMYGRPKTGPMEYRENVWSVDHHKILFLFDLV